MRPTVPDCSTSLPPSVKRRLELGLLVGLLTCTLATAPLSACVRKNNKAGGAWVTINGNNVMIKVRGFQTFSPSESADCGCGLQNTQSLATMTSAAARRADNGQVVFSLSPDSGVGGTFAGIDPDSSPWFGFRKNNISSIPEVPVDLVFTGTLAPGATFDSIKAELESAGHSVGFGRIDDNQEGPEICPITPVDLLSPAPAFKVRQMGMTDPHFVELAAVDAEEGLATLRVVESVNAVESLPLFPPGTVDPVNVRFTMTEGKVSASLGLEACNVQGICATWRGEVVDLKLGPDGSASRGLTDVPPARRQIRLQNGNPGVAMFVLTANGKRFSLRPLAAGQWLSLNAALAVDEPLNALTLGAFGASGSELMVLMMAAPNED